MSALCREPVGSQWVLQWLLPPTHLRLISACSPRTFRVVCSFTMLMKVASRSRLREQKKKQREQSVFALFLANASTIVEIRSLFRWATEVLRRHVIEELNILFRRLGIASSI